MTHVPSMTMPLGNHLIYQQLIAGCVPVPSTGAEDAAAKIASDILQDHRLHIVTAVSDGSVFFLAFPSRLAGCTQDFSTPLAQALPTHPQHRGDGIYVLADANAAVIKRIKELHVVPLASSNIESLSSEYGLPVFTLGPDAAGWPMESIYGRNRKTAEQMAKRTARASRLVLVGSLILYVGVTVSDVAVRFLAEKWAARSKVAQTVQRFQYVSPLAEQLAHLQTVFGTVVRAGGWINGYVWKQGQEAFEIALPGWVSHDYVDALGPGAIADFNVPDNLVVVRKGKLGGEDKASPDGPQ